MVEALPTAFDFYHLGRIELEDESSPETHEIDAGFASDHFGIGYRLEGERRGGIVLCVAKGLDASVYSEAGNIIASRFASALAKHDQREVTVSPPLLLSSMRLKALLASGSGAVKTYIHRQGGQNTALRVLLLLDFSEATGNA